MKPVSSKSSNLHIWLRSQSNAHCLKDMISIVEENNKGNKYFCQFPCDQHCLKLFYKYSSALRAICKFTDYAVLDIVYEPNVIY